MRRETDGVIRHRETTSETESSSGAADNFRSSATQFTLIPKDASLLVRIFLFPLTFAITIFMKVATLSYQVPTTLWHSLWGSNDFEASQHSFIITPGHRRHIPFFSKVSLRTGWVTQQFENKVLPVIVALVTFPLTTLTPWVLQQKIFTFFVPFALWKALIDYFGSQEQMLSGWGLRNGSDSGKISAETDALNAQKAQVEKENNILKLKLKDFETGWKKMTADIACKSEELKNNQVVLKENEMLRLKLKDLEEGWRQVSSELKATKESSSQKVALLESLLQENAGLKLEMQNIQSKREVEAVQQNFNQEKALLESLQQENEGLKEELQNIQCDREVEAAKNNSDQQRALESLQQENAALKEEIQNIQRNLDEEAAKVAEVKINAIRVQQEIEQLREQHAQELTQLKNQIREENTGNNFDGQREELERIAREQAEHQFQQELSNLRDEVTQLVSEKSILENENLVLRQQLDVFPKDEHSGTELENEEVQVHDSKDVPHQEGAAGGGGKKKKRGKKN